MRCAELASEARGLPCVAGSGQRLLEDSGQVQPCNSPDRTSKGMLFLTYQPLTAEDGPFDDAELNAAAAALGISREAAA